MSEDGSKGWTVRDHLRARVERISAADCGFHRAFDMTAANVPTLTRPLHHSIDMNQHSRSHSSSFSTCVVVLVAFWMSAGAMAGEATVRPTTRPWLDMPQAPPTPTGALTPTIAFPHLTFQGPVSMVLAPRSNRFYVCEREGRIWSFENDPATTTKTLVLDLSAQCQGLDDCGLMGLAFHPDFGLPASTNSANRGKFFVYYEYTDQTPLQGDAPVYRPNKTGQYSQMSTHLWNRLSSFTIADGEVVATPTETVLINQRDRHPWHGGGGMFFHPDDGFLWLVIGDEGASGDSYGRSQRLNGGLFSGVLRIDVDGPRTGKSHAIRRKPDLGDATTTTANYGIPIDNPFVGVPSVLEEFWAVGLRSPHRMTHDPVSGMVLIGDIGQGSREEISLVIKGGNYQWVYREGNGGSGTGPSYQINQVGGHTGGSSELTIDTNGNSRGGTLLNERVVFAGVTGTYTVTAVAGFPHTRITITPPLAGPVANDAVITRTTGLTLTAALTAGATVLPVTGSGMALAPRDCVRVQGLSETYRVTSADANSVTITPALTGTAALGARIDLNPVIGREQAPVIDFTDRGAFRAIIGGYIYRGSRHPDLVGKYIFGDNPSGVIWSIDPTQYPATATIISNLSLTAPYDGGDSGYRGLSSFAVDADGELYLLRMQYRVDGDQLPSILATTGRILTLERVAGPTDPVIPTQLSATGAFNPTGSGTANWPLVPKSDLIPYDVNSPLWSDGAHKSRWIALPNPTGKTAGFDPGEQIAFAATGEWTFPAGTVFVKHFELTVNEQTGARKRLETRLLLRKPAPAGGVYGVTYRWRADNSDADLIDDAESEAITVTLADGVSTRVQTWNYPGRADCLSCHNDNAHWVLGVKTRQQNGPCSDPAFPTTNQLRTWSAIGMFDNPPLEADLPNLARTVPIDHPSATIENQARSWLDANCSHCHRPGGVQAFFDARYDTALSQQGIVDGDVGLDLGVTNARVIARGSLSRSILHVRDSSLTAGIKMPPLAKNRVDDPAMAVISAWITSLGATQSVAITSPSSGDALGLPGPFNITADTGASTWVTRVDFKVDGVVVGSDTSAPYSCAWTPTVTGTYQLTATVKDNTGASTTSAAGTVTTVKSPATIAFTTGSLAQTYNTFGKTVTATTTPAGLPVTYGYPGGTPPVNAGSHTVSATVDHPHYQGTITGQLVISKATATVALDNAVVTYDGNAHAATATTTPAGLTVDLVYTGVDAARIAAGTYGVSATIADANYQGSTTGNLVIGKATATITLSDLTYTYNGMQKSATVTTVPAALPYTIAYTGDVARSNAGTYGVTANIVDANYDGSAIGNLVIGKAAATITLSDLTYTYNGMQKSATVSTVPAALPYTIAYTGDVARSNAGTYGVTATIVDANYDGSANGSLIIGKATATVTLQNLVQTVDGAAKPVTVTTTPSGLTTVVTYDGSGTVPTALGTYTVVAEIVEVNYSGTVTEHLQIIAQPVIDLAAASSNEGHSGTTIVTMVATLSLASSSVITVDWAANAGTAQAGDDFTVANGTLTFAAGVLTQPITITVHGDITFEPNETVIVTLTNPTAVVIGDGVVNMTIVNDDANSAPLIAEGAAVAVTGDEDNTPTAVELTLHASDVDVGQGFTWSLITPPTHGTLAPLGSDAIQVIGYQPVADFNGSDNFTVQVADDHGGFATCVVTLTIAPRNDAPRMLSVPLVTLGLSATANTGTWSDGQDLIPGTITLALQWQRANDAGGSSMMDLVGETTSTHHLTTADAGKFLRVRVTASDDGEGLPAATSTIAYSEYVAVPTAGGSSSGGGNGGGSGGGGCGLGSGITGLLVFVLILLRRNRLR